MSFISIAEYDYMLPPERIAAVPLSKREASKLLIFSDSSIIDDFFYNLKDHLPSNSLLILNDTRVIEARIFFTKDTGATIEIFLLEPYQASIEETLQHGGSVYWKVLIGGASKWKPGQVLSKKLLIEANNVELTAKYIKKEDDYFVVELSWNSSHIFSDILHNAGKIPLPPYIKRETTEQDTVRYQTVFSRNDGSVAAPTAALHFTDSILNDLKQKSIDVGYLTLHVGAGTFKPVKTEDISAHHMHEEPFSISKKLLQSILAAEKIIVVGTTSLRCIESIYWMGIKLMNNQLNNDWVIHQWDPYSLADNGGKKDFKMVITKIIDWMDLHQLETINGRTSLMIVPGYTFAIPDAIITNFHLPKSTLLLLVSAFTNNNWKKIYEHALANDYRFLSYGDSSLLWRNK
jgi:S-adenosylmethionine:tRNA ribosyltransferase-isomerase